MNLSVYVCEREREREREREYSIIYLSRETNDQYPKQEEKPNQHDSREHCHMDQLE